MKKLILGFIFLNSLTYFIFGMEQRMQEGKKEEPLFDFPKLEPELQVYTIQQGIQARLNSNSDPAGAYIDALKYLYTTTSANNFLLSKKLKFENELKQWAIEKFAPEYANLSQKELNQKINTITNSAIPKNEAATEITKLIIAGADPDLILVTHTGFGQFTNPLLNQAIAYGAINLVRLLISYGANPNLSTNLGVTPLMTAVRNNKLLGLETTIQIIDLLLKQGADINLKTASGTALTEAFKDANLDLTKVLLDYGAIPDENALTYFKGKAAEAIRNQAAVAANEALQKKFAEKVEIYRQILDLLQEHGYLRNLKI